MQRATTSWVWGLSQSPLTAVCGCVHACVTSNALSISGEKRLADFLASEFAVCICKDNAEFSFTIRGGRYQVQNRVVVCFKIIPITLNLTSHHSHTYRRLLKFLPSTKNMIHRNVSRLLFKLEDNKYPFLAFIFACVYFDYPGHLHHILTPFCSAFGRARFGWVTIICVKLNLIEPSLPTGWGMRCSINK